MATLVSASPEVIQDLRQKLIAADTPLAAKYRALYSLRGVEGLEAHLGLVDGECLDTCYTRQYSFCEPNFCSHVIIHVLQHPQLVVFKAGPADQNVMLLLSNH